METIRKRVKRNREFFCKPCVYAFEYEDGVDCANPNDESPPCSSLDKNGKAMFFIFVKKEEKK